MGWTIVACLALTLCGTDYVDNVIAAPTAAAQTGPDNVLYLLTSDAPITEITWFDSQGNTRRDTSATSHAWYWSFTNTDRPARYRVAGRTSGSYIRCQILINARVVADHTGPQAATCAL